MINYKWDIIEDAASNFHDQNVISESLCFGTFSCKLWQKISLIRHCFGPGPWSQNQNVVTLLEKHEREYGNEVVVTKVDSKLKYFDIKVLKAFIT